MRQDKPDKPSQGTAPEFYDRDKRFVAQFLGLSPFTVDRYVLAGEIPHIKLRNRLIRFKISDLVKFAESQRVA